MIKHLTSLFISQSCYACDQALTSQERLVCFSCISHLQATNFHTKPRENELYYRLAGRVPLQGASSLYYFDKKGTLQTLIQQLKYKGATPVGTLLGELLASSLMDSDFLHGIEVVIPIPLHRSKKLQRGFNQSEYIAKGFSGLSSIPMNTTLLKRNQKTLTQTKLAPTTRWKNVSKAFEVKKASPKSVLLLDDVITTGATVEASIRALLSSPVPPQEIKVVSIGMARNS